MNTSRSPLVLPTLTSLALLLSLALSARAFAQTPAPQGVIEGQAVIASANSNAPLDALPASLFTFIDGARQVPPATALTDARGHVRFVNLNTTSHFTYTLFIKFQDTIYGSGAISFASGRNVAEATVKVFDVTSDQRALRVDQHHLIIDVDETAHALDVLEFYQLTNTGDRAIVGATEPSASNKRVSFRAPIPPDAQVQTIEERTPNTNIFQANNELLDTVPIAPGPAELVFEYRVPYQRATIALALTSPYSVTMLNVLVAPNVRVRSPRLTFQQNVDANGRSFQHYSARDLPPNTSIAIELNNLPAPLIPLDVLQWLPLAAVSVALAVALFVAYRRTPDHAAPRRQTPA